MWAGGDEEYPKVLGFSLSYVLATECLSFAFCFFFFQYPPTLEKSDRRQ